MSQLYSTQPVNNVESNGYDAQSREKEVPVRGTVFYHAETDSVRLISEDGKKMYILPNNTEIQYWHIDCLPTNSYLFIEPREDDGVWRLGGTWFENEGMNGMLIIAFLRLEEETAKGHVIDLGEGYISGHNPNVLPFSETEPFAEYPEFSMLDNILGFFGGREADKYNIYIRYILQDAYIDRNILEMIRDFYCQKDALWSEIYLPDECKKAVELFITGLERYVRKQKLNWIS